MKTLMYVAHIVSTGQLDLDGGQWVETGRTHVSVVSRNESGKHEYHDYHDVDSDQIGYDTFAFELSEESFTIDEIHSYIAGAYREEYVEYQIQQREAIKVVAMMTSRVGSDIEEILKLSREFNIPANITINGETNDLRVIESVDWNSSSMYC